MTDQPMAHPPREPAAAADGMIRIDEVQRLALRMGVVISAKDHPNADRLLVLNVDLGDGAPRQIVAGIRGSYQAADVVGKCVVVVANLKPALLRGIESQGMVLAASDERGVVLLTADRALTPGSIVK